MKVLLVANYKGDASESMGRFASLMFRGLSSAGVSVRITRPPLIAGRLRQTSTGVGKWLGYIDKFALFPLELRRAAAWADVIHICDHSHAMYVHCLGKRPCVITCHDLLAVKSALGEVPTQPTKWTGRQLQRMILSGLRDCDHIVGVSEATCKDVLRIVRKSPRRVSLAYNCLRQGLAPVNSGEARRLILRMGIDPGVPVILHVGGNQWYKNRLGVIRIFERLVRNPQFSRFSLAMVGKPFTREMSRFIVERSLTGRVLELSNVCDEELKAFYSVARFLLFPSLAEGFGWPIIEAQSHGCPVVTADRPPMTEVAGSAAIYLDPEDCEAASATLISQISRLDEMRFSGMENAKRFHMAAMIEKYLNVYAEVAQ